MSQKPLTCPRCDAEVRGPGMWSDSWTCPEHGAVAPLHPGLVPSDEVLRQVAGRSQVPLWLPWPLPAGWLVSGVRYAGDEHTGPVATVLALSGPNPILLDTDDALAADLLVVAEQPGVGLASRLAGLDWIDPGGAIASATPATKIVAAGHETPMWSVTTERSDRIDLDPVAAYVGEALGVWLWALTWPRAGAAVFMDGVELLDLRDPEHGYPVPFGALSPRLH